MDKETKRKYPILVVDDEPLIRESLYEILRIDGYRVHMAPSGEEALKVIYQHPVQIVLTDFKLPQMSGLRLLEEIKKEAPHIDVILITGFGTVESAVSAMKQGAYDYITKPINDQEVKMIIEKIIDKKELTQENQDLRQIVAQARPDSFCDMIGRSDPMQKIYHIIESVASSNATVLITGESGTGKGMVAKGIHRMDERRCRKPFVEVSCGAISETLLESELFGHAKGAFTGAIKEKEGRFEYARGGTVFLDEIDAFSLNLQVKLLRVLQDGVFERVGDNMTRQTDARIIVATNRRLEDLVAEGGFREDLYYRINVISIAMPPLRERKDDLEMLIDYFVKQYARRNNKQVEGVSESLKDLFKGYHWPGNVRELENAIEGAVVMARSRTIDVKDVPGVDRFSRKPQPELLVSDEGVQSLKKVKERPERDMILAVLEECNWNRSKAAEALGINRTTLYNKIKKYKIRI